MYYNYYLGRDGRTGIIAPLLLGGLIGGTAVGVSRPRPVFVNGGYQPYPRPYPPYGYYGNYGYYNNYGQFY